MRVHVESLSSLCASASLHELSLSSSGDAEVDGTMIKAEIREPLDVPGTDAWPAGGRAGALVGPALAGN